MAKRIGCFALYKPIAINNLIYSPMKELYEGLKNFEGMVQVEEDRIEITAAANRCMEFNNTIPAFLNQHLDGYVYWLEIIEKKTVQPYCLFMGFQ